MPISITCANCQHEFRVHDDFVGKRGKCPRCENIFRAPKPGQTPPPPPPPPAASPTLAVGVAVPKPPPADLSSGDHPAKALTLRSMETQATTVTPSSSGRRPRQSAGPLLLWLVISLGGLGVVGGWVFYTLSQRDHSGQQPPENVVANAPLEETEIESDDIIGKPQRHTPAPVDRALPKKDYPAKSSPVPAGRSPVLPLPTGDGEPGRPSIAPAENEPAKPITELAADCGQFQFMPSTAAEYARLAALAEAIAQVAGPEDRNWEAGRAAYQSIVAAEWTPDALQRLNRFATRQAKEAQVGIVFLGSVAGRGDDATLLALDGADTAVLVLKEAQIFTAAAQSRWLVVGQTSTEVLEVEREDGTGPARTVRVVDRTRAAQIKARSEIELPNASLQEPTD